MIFCRKSYKAALIFAACLWVLAACKKQPPRQDKLLRIQLSQHLRDHSYEAALPIARRLVEVAPQDGRGWKRLAQLQLRLHNLDGLTQTLDEWRRTVPTSPARLIEYQGNLAKAKGDTARAGETWQKALALEPNNRRVLRKISLLNQSQQHWAEAIAGWTRFLKIQDDVAGRVNLALCERRLRDWDHAFQNWHRAQQLAPDDPEVRRWSRLFENLSTFLPQLRELDAKVQAVPNNAGLLTDRALMLLGAGDPELALDDCEAAGALAPWSVRPKLFHAIALISLDRAAEAEHLSIRQPLRLEMLTPEFLETMSRLDSAIAVERTNAEHFVARSWQLNEIGQPMLAFQDAQEAARLDQKSGSARAEVGYSLMKLGHAKEAFEQIKRATELDPNLVSAWQYRGELEMTQGNNLAAIESFSRSLDVERTVAALQRREECYRRVGLTGRAEEDRHAVEQLSAGSDTHN